VTAADHTFRPSHGRWQARILDTDGAVRGSGVLISDRHVLTCAHVLSEDATHPETSFVIDFPRSGDNATAPARVIPGGWFPETASRRDIAVLEIEREPPKDVTPARLGRWEGTSGSEAVVFGHPAGIEQGVWTATRIVDSVGERIQLTSSLNGAPERIEPGYSGGGVIASASGRVVGIVVTSYLSGTRIVAFMIPMETVALYWDAVALFVGGTDAEDLLAEAALAELEQVFSSVQELAHEDNRKWIAERLPHAARLQLSEAEPSVHALVRACQRRADMRVLADLVRYRDTEALITGTLEDRLHANRVPRSVTGAEQAPELGIGARQDLHRVLLQQPSFQSRAARTVLFDELGRQLGVAEQLATSGNAADDAWSLIGALHPAAGALRAILPFFIGGGGAYRQLETLVDLLSPARLLTDAEREELLGLLDGVPAEPLAEARRRAGIEPSSVEPAELPTLVRAVEEQTQVGALPRIFTFTEYVAAQTPERTRDLQLWSDRCAARQHLQFRDLADLRTRLVVLGKEGRQVPTLVIQLAPDALLPTELFQLSAALQRPGEAQRLLVISDDAEPLEAIRSRVDDLFGEVYRELGYEPAALTVEVVVPRALLTEAVDRWDVTDLLPVPMGSRFLVVLRSYERLRQDRLWPAWRHKWKLAQEQQRPGADTMHYVGPDDRSSAVEIAASLQPDRKLALVCGRPPDRQRDLKPYDAYVAALSAGVAYMLWTRDVALAEALRDEVQRALDAIPVRELPRRIAQWRAPRNDSAADPAADLGGNVSVLVCGYDRRVHFNRGVLKSPSRREQP
jgi:vWA-MoxR associated protein C-terminal domain/Trypsin-like peptidase domain